MAAEAYLTGAAANVTSTIIGALFQKLNDVTEFEENLQILDSHFSSMEGLLIDFRNQFQDQQKGIPEPVERCLENMNTALGEARNLIDLGSGIRSAQDQLRKWLSEPHCQSRVIGVCGMAGAGKTSLLKVIYNTYKEEVSGIFDFVLWFVVSQNFQIKELQKQLGLNLGLNLEEISDIEERKMRLYASLHKKKFLIVLDDIWSPIDLINEVGVRFGDDNPSKIIISSRKKEVIGRMGAIEYSLQIQPLSTEEGWELFRRRAFTNGVVTDSNIEEAIAKEIAAECKGLPLAINAVAAALSWKKTNDEWSRALIMMKNADPSFPITHDTIDAELYQKVRWSYNDLPHPNLKICFLYCAAFPEDAYIHVERLVEMWSGEGLVSPRGTTNFMDIGRQYIDVLVSRCLVEYHSHEWLKVHDVLRDMAICGPKGGEVVICSRSTSTEFP